MAHVPVGSTLPPQLTLTPGWLFSGWVWRAGVSCWVGLRAVLFEEGWASGQSLLCPREGVSRAGGGGVSLPCLLPGSLPLPVTPALPSAGLLLVAMVFRQD